MIKARILIVEDEVIIAMELKNQLQNLGYEVTSVVNTGDKALQKAESDKPDLILMDIRIKGKMDGIETAEAIRPRFGIPIVFSTAYLDQERIERAKLTMPFGYLLKPIQERDLKVTIEMALYVSRIDAERRKTEEELKRSEELLNNTGEMARVGGWEVNLEKETVYWSNTTKLIHEVPLDYEPTLEEAINYFPGESGRIINEAVNEAINSGKSYELELDFLTAKGNKLSVWTIGNAQFENGKCSRLFGTFQDITKLRKTEEGLKKSEEWFSTTLKSIGDAVITADINSNVTLLNPVAESLTGWNQKDAQGKPLGDIFHIINEETREPVENPVKKVIKTGNIVGLANHTILIAKDGKEIPIDDSGSPIRNDKGEVFGVALVFRDITERKLAEKALQLSGERFRTLFENIQDGFALHELVYDDFQKPIDYIFLEINSSFERLTGLKKEDILGKRVTEAIPGIENDPADWIGTYAKVVINNKPINFEQFSESLKKWYACRAFKTEENCFAVSFTDISDRKKAEL